MKCLYSNVNHSKSGRFLCLCVFSLNVKVLSDSCVDGWLSINANIASSRNLFKDDCDDSSFILLVGKENIEQT